MDITHVHIDFLDGLAINRSAETEHTMGGRVLRADIYNEILFGKHGDLLFLNRAVSLFDPGIGRIALALVFNRNGIEFGSGVIVLAQGVAHPVDVQEKSTHIGIADKHDSIEIIHLAFENACDTIQVGNAVEHRFVAVGGLNLHRHQLPGGGGSEIIDTTHRGCPVHTHYSNQIIEPMFVAEALNEVMKLCVRYVNEQNLTVLESGIGKTL